MATGAPELRRGAVDGRRAVSREPPRPERVPRRVRVRVVVVVVARFPAIPAARASPLGDAPGDVAPAHAPARASAAATTALPRASITPGHRGHGAVPPPHVSHSHHSRAASRTKCAPSSPHHEHHPRRVVSSAFVSAGASQSYTSPRHRAHAASPSLANPTTRERWSLLVSRSGGEELPRIYVPRSGGLSHSAHRVVHRAHRPHENTSAPLSVATSSACLARPRHHEHRATGARRSRASASSRASRGQRGKTPRWTRQRSSSQSARPRACASHPARRHGSVLRAHPPHRNVARRSQKPSPTCAWDVTRAHHEQRFSANAGRRTGSGRPPMGASDAYSTSSALEPLEPRSAPRRGR